MSADNVDTLDTQADLAADKNSVKITTDYGQNLQHHTVVFVVQIKRGPTKNVYSNTELSVPVHFGPSYLAVAITPFKVIQGHRFWYQSKAHMRLVINSNVFCTVSEI